jgi:hypothetical protein
MQEFDSEFSEKIKGNLKSVYFGLIRIVNMKVRIEPMFSRFRLNPVNIPIFQPELEF